VYGFRWIFKGNKKTRRRWLILSGLFLTLLFFCLYFLFSRPTANLEQPEPQMLLTKGIVKKKSTLYQSLLEKNIPIRWINLIISELKSYVDFNRIKGGTWRFFTDARGELVKFIFEKSPLEVYKLEKGPQGYVAQRDEVSMEKHLVKVEGEIRTSLYEAMNVRLFSMRFGLKQKETQTSTLSYSHPPVLLRSMPSRGDRRSFFKNQYEKDSV